MPQAASFSKEAFMPLLATVKQTDTGLTGIEKSPDKSNTSDASMHRVSFDAALARQTTAGAAGEETDSQTTADGNDLPLTGGQLPPVTDDILTLKLDHITAQDQADADPVPWLAGGFMVAPLTRAIRDIDADSGDLIKKDRSQPVLLTRLQASLSMKADTGVRLVMTPGNLELAANAAAEPVNKIETSENTLSRYQAVELKSVQSARVELNVPRLASPNWGESIAGRISIMVNQRITNARIHINPPELGPIEVRLNLNNEQASVQFTSHSSMVRDALEQSIPRLREMLESAGFSLVESDVKDQSSGNGSSDRHNPMDSDATDQDIPEPGRQRISIGLIDHYV